MNFHRIAALASAACLSACAGVVLPLPTIGGAAVSGRVVEEGSGKPVSDAIVAAYWEGVVPIRGNHTCMHVETATTAADGTFTTPAWTFPTPATYSEPEMRYRVFKPGMVLRKQSLIGVTLEMARFQGSRKDRLDELQRYARSARCEGHPSAGIARIKAAIAEEMQQLATTPEESRQYVEWVRTLSRTEMGAAEKYLSHFPEKRGANQ